MPAKQIINPDKIISLEPHTFAFFNAQLHHVLASQKEIIEITLKCSMKLLNERETFTGKILLLERDISKMNHIGQIVS